MSQLSIENRVEKENLYIDIFDESKPLIKKPTVTQCTIFKTNMKEIYSGAKTVLTAATPVVSNVIGSAACLTSLGLQVAVTYNEHGLWIAALFTLGLGFGVSKVVMDLFAKNFPDNAFIKKLSEITNFGTSYIAAGAGDVAFIWATLQSTVGVATNNDIFKYYGAPAVAGLLGTFKVAISFNTKDSKDIKVSEKNSKWLEYYHAAMDSLTGTAVVGMLGQQGLIKSSLPGFGILTLFTMAGVVAKALKDKKPLPSVALETFVKVLGKDLASIGFMFGTFINIYAADHLEADGKHHVSDGYFFSMLGIWAFLYVVMASSSVMQKIDQHKESAKSLPIQAPENAIALKSLVEDEKHNSMDNGYHYVPEQGLTHLDFDGNTLDDSILDDVISSKFK